MEHPVLPLPIFGVAVFEHHDTVAMMFSLLEFTFVVAVLVLLEGRQGCLAVSEVIEPIYGLSLEFIPSLLKLLNSLF